MGHAHAALRPIGPCGLAVQMPVFIVLVLLAHAHARERQGYLLLRLQCSQLCTGLRLEQSGGCHGGPSRVVTIFGKVYNVITTAAAGCAKLPFQSSLEFAVVSGRIPQTEHRRCRFA